MTGVQEGVNKLLRVQHDQEHEAILKWLTPIEYAPQQSDIISRRQEGTGQWLLDSDEFHAWISQSGETLFCPGIPGAGKTMMSAIVIDHLKARFENNADIGVAYIYCSYQPQQVQKPEDLLSSLLKQLVQNQPIISSDVKDFYKCHGSKGSRPSFAEIAKVLHVTVRLYSRVFIILDALDEYYVSNNDGHRMLLSEIFKLQDQVQANLLTTSRPVAEIISQFDRCVSKEILAQDEDILRYINERIPRLLRSKILEYPAVQDAIRSSIVRAAHGMYVYLFGLKCPLN
jgi:Cdc6-like AAA superfamily ATPase